MLTLADIPKLTDVQHYSDWQSALKVLLLQQGCWRVVDGSEPEPAFPSAAVTVDANWAGMLWVSWIDRDTEAQELILSTVGEPLQPQLLRDQTSAQMWTTLSDMHANHVAYLWRVLGRLMLSEGGDRAAHLDAFMRSAFEVMQAGKGTLQEAPEDTVIQLFLTSLPVSLRSIVRLEFKSLPKDRQTWPALKQIFRPYIAEQEAEFIALDSAFTGRPPKSMDQVKCQGCHRKGHYRCDCKSDDDGPVRYAMGVQVCDPRTAAAGPAKADIDAQSVQWVISTAASEHIVSSAEHLESVEQLAKPCEFFAAGGSVFAKRKGQFRGVSSRRKRQCIHLGEVYVLPGAANNLLSVGQLVRHGWSISFGKRGGVITKGSHHIQFLLDRGLYRVTLPVLKTIHD